MENNAVKTNVERILIVKKQPRNASNVRWFLAGNRSGRAQGDAAAKMLAGKKVFLLNPANFAGFFIFIDFVVRFPFKNEAE